MKLTSLGFAEGMLLRAMGAIAPSGRKVFDWHKAAELIRANGLLNVEAGLAEDWGYTSGYILSEGERVPKEKTYVFLASDWATPVLHDVDTDIVYECYIHDTDEENPQGWNADTYWPESAVALMVEELVEVSDGEQ